MRSFKKIGITFVAFAMLVTLVGCAPPAAGTGFDASEVACTDVQPQLATESNDLKAAKSSLKEVAGTPGEVDAQAGVDKVQEKVDALKARATECKSDAGATPSPIQTGTGTCTDQFTQESTSHEGNKVDDKFYDKYTAAIANVSNLSEAQRDLFIAEAANDAKKLAIWSGLVHLYDDQNDWKSLVTEDDTCLNEAGKELWYTLKGAVTAKGVTFEEAQAPESWWNSGMHGDTYGTSSTQGIRGDRTAIKITLTDGTVAYILVRCGNPVYPGKPSLPEVPTDNPEPAPKNINDAPQRQGNLPTQQMPNVLPAAPEHAQPAAPADPPATYTPPAAAPVPVPAPVTDPGTGTPIPAPTPEPTPVVTTPPVAPAPAPSDPGTSTPCAPGRTTC